MYCKTTILQMKLTTIIMGILASRSPQEMVVLARCCCRLLIGGGCHGPCSVMFFPKNNQRTAPTESPMMATSPLFSATMLSLEFGRRCRVRSHARRWLQLVGCAALLLDASNFGGPDGVGESGVEPRRSLRRRERVKEK